MERVEFPQDCIRIRKCLNDLGYDASLKDAEELWQDYSEEEYCAGWVYLPKDDEELKACLSMHMSGNVLFRLAQRKNQRVQLD